MKPNEKRKEKEMFYKVFYHYPNENPKEWLHIEYVPDIESFQKETGCIIDEIEEIEENDTM